MKSESLRSAGNSAGNRGQNPIVHQALIHAMRIADNCQWQEFPASSQEALERGARLAAVKEAADRVSEQPFLYAVVHRETRRALVRRFPYGLYYKLLDRKVVVVACFHTSGNPLIWKRRK